MNTQTLRISQQEYELRKKFNSYVSGCKQVVIGRDVEVSLIACSWLAKANVMLLGTPGEGKSFLAHTVLNNLKGTSSFFTQCSPETDMDSIFGTPIFSELQEGKIIRNLSGGLVDCDFAFIDEIGKASDSLHKSMFTVLNERVFVNGTAGTIKTPLISAIAASNEQLSSETAGLNSRFHVKAICKKLTSPQRFELLSRRNKRTKLVIPDEIKLSLSDIEQAQKYTSQIIIPDDIIEKIVQIGEVLSMSSEPDSRKLEICVDLIKASTWLQMQQVPTKKQLGILKFVLWDNAYHEKDVADVIDDFLN